MPRAVLLKGDALQLAEELERKRAEVQADLQREARMHQTKVQAITDAWQVYVKTMLDRLAEMEGFDPARTGLDPSYLQLAGAVFLTEADLLEEHIDVPDEAEEEPQPDMTRH